ncbi:MAG: TIGR03619 family F420-dependent LLM class oxidoreductase [Actinobacteria bacterium]|nr:TIGR03619 family F420-dependent LLM class oxidoreductase [Actinomycetota bacterium]
MTKPQISIQLRTFQEDDPGSWQFLLDQARAADVAGIDRVVFSDHVAFGEDLEAYGDPKKGGTMGGKQPTSPDGQWLEPLTVITAIGALTERIRLGTAILIAALRTPVVLAKTAATIDVLTNGRLELGVGVGWQRDEYVAAGLDYENRGRLLDHTIEVCQLLWREQVASYASPELTFDNIHQMPKPRQAGGVPIWVSGTINKRVVRRLADYGSGWIPWGPDGADLVGAIPRLRAAVEAAGGDPTFQVQGHAIPVRDADGNLDLTATFEASAPLIEAGVTDLRITVPAVVGYDESLALYSDVATKFRSALH